jgi:hypothetical protein
MMEPLSGLDNRMSDYLLGELGDFRVGSSPERSVGMGKTVDAGENSGGVKTWWMD